MPKIILIMIYLLSSCIILYAQEPNVLDIENRLDTALLEIIRESALEFQTERQERIKSFNDLPGTYWIIEDLITDPFLGRLDALGFIFLGNNIVLVIKARPINSSDGFRLLILQSIAYVKKYEIIGNKIVISQNMLSGYLENSNMFFGSEAFGYAKYKLEGNFIPLRE
jgi:hypothetical protein